MINYKNYTTFLISYSIQPELQPIINIVNDIITNHLLNNSDLTPEQIRMLIHYDIIDKDCKIVGYEEVN